MQGYLGQNPQTLVYTSILDVQVRLRGLGLTLEWLLDALEYAWGYWAICTPNDVGNAQGSMLYFGCNRGLRDQLIPQRWSTDVFNGVEVTVHPSQLLAIRVQSGDSATGDPRRVPSNKNESGYQSAKLVEGYQLRLLLEIDEQELASPNSIPVWVLLTHPAGEELVDLRVELSLPATILNGRVVDWEERIIIPDRDSLGISRHAADGLDSLDIQVRRRA